MAQTGIWPVNLSTTITKFDVFIPQMDAGIKARVHALADQILDDSKNISPTVPIDDDAEHRRRYGTAPHLIETGRVEQAEGGWAVVYGGDGVDYANQVHDDLRPRRYRIAGSGPKFIEVHYLHRTDIADEDLIQTVMNLVDQNFTP